MTTISILLSSHPIPLSFSLNKSPLFPKSSTVTRRIRRRTGVEAKSKGDNSVDGPDRLISAVCYLYPFFDGVQYGKYVVAQVAPLQMLIQPLVPAIRVFKSFPFNGFLVFFLLYFVVVRNPNFSRYVRFNTMQAIMLDVLLILPDLLERSFNPRDGLGLDLMMSLDSTVFLFLLVCLIYGSSSCLLGQVPRLPIVAEAAETQPWARVKSINGAGEVTRSRPPQCVPGRRWQPYPRLHILLLQCGDLSIQIEGTTNHCHPACHNTLPLIYLGS